MAFKIPEIGEWYIDQQLGQLFEVIAFDDHEHSIEIQYVDGELSEVDIEGWRQMSVKTAAAPEDWSASYEVSREDKHHVIMKINSVRTHCPSDASFTGQFTLKNKIYEGEVKVLFSKGTFFVSKTGSNIQELMNTLINALNDQIAVWKDVRFDQPETFIDYSEWIERTNATGS